MVSAPTKMPATKIAAGTHGERLEAGEHGDHDAGIAEAAGEVRREIPFQPRNLGRAGKPGQPTRTRATTTITPVTPIPVKRAAAAFSPTARIFSPSTVRDRRTCARTLADKRDEEARVQTHALHERRQHPGVERSAPTAASRPPSGP